MDRFRFTLPLMAAALTLLIFPAASNGQTPLPRSTTIRTNSDPASDSLLVNDLAIAALSAKSISFELKSIQQPKELVPHLFFRGRVHWPVPGGHVSNALAVEVNGRRLTSDRLTNRPADGVMARGDHTIYVQPDGRIVLWYSPDFDAVDQSSDYKLVGGIRAAEYEFRLDGLLHEGRNEIRFLNLAAAVAESDRTARLANVTLRYAQRREAQLTAEPPVGPLTTYEPRLAQPAGYQLSNIGDGALTLDVGDESFEIQSRFSSPDGSWNHGSNASFEHRREFEQHDEWILVRDTFANRTGRLIPIIQQHRSHFAAIQSLNLCGMRVPSRRGVRQDAGNPSIFATTQRAGFGMIALNDVFRIHCRVSCEQGMMQIADPYFVLQPGGTYTSELAIVPVATGDFWDFINAGRRLLGVNFRLDLCSTFLFSREPVFEWSDQRLREFVKFKGANFLVQSNEVSRYLGEYTYSTAFAEADLEPYRAFQKRVRTLFPDGSIRTGVYYHCFLDNYRGNEARFAPDAVITSDGNPLDYGDDNSSYKIYLPTLENAFGRETEKNIELILNDIGSDGVYWDEHQYCRAKYSYNPDHFDNVSAGIDPDSFQITRQKGALALVSLPWRKKQIERILATGNLMTNGAPGTRTLSELHYPAFTETGSISYCRRMLLYSPIALADHRSVQTQLDAYRAMHRQLDNGCLHAWYSHLVVPEYPTITDYMFPFTPIDLRSGYVFGEERILTNRSGYFGWGDDSEFDVHVYDGSGRETTLDVPQVERNGKRYAEIRLPSGYAAAIVRRR